MRTYYAINGQSLADVCMNTYGSMDFFYKLLTDNNIPDANILPSTGLPFSWDETLVVDFVVGQTLTKNNIKYATAASGNGSVYYVVVGTPTTPPVTSGGGGTSPQPQQIMYQKTSSFYYTSAASAGETIIAIVPLQGKQILQIEKNIQVLLPTEYSWNSTTGVLTLSEAIYEDEKLFILYTEMVTI